MLECLGLYELLSLLECLGLLGLIGTLTHRNSGTTSGFSPDIHKNKDSNILIPFALKY